MAGAWDTWRAPLYELCDDIRAAVSSSLEAGGAPAASSLARPAGEGAGDVTFGLDRVAEARALAWARERARHGPLSLLTEDAGWLHLGPLAEGGVRDLEGFDHGGPRLVLDPIDGTRNLMAGLRPAWTVVGFAPPGSGQPRLSDLTAGIVSELPPPGTLTLRRLTAAPGAGCTLTHLDRGTAPVELRPDADDRCDQGYLPFFRYRPEERPLLARLEAAFFERLERGEGADLRSVYDDQYISNAGQLVLLMLGTYRLIVDARALVAERLGRPTVTSKPYDLAGALVCARAAGVPVTAADGTQLDFPLDARTPVHFAGYANPATRARLEPHLLAALAETLPS